MILNICQNFCALGIFMVGSILCINSFIIITVQPPLKSGFNLFSRIIIKCKTKGTKMRYLGLSLSLHLVRPENQLVC